MCESYTKVLRPSDYDDHGGLPGAQVRARRAAGPSQRQRGRRRGLYYERRESGRIRRDRYLRIHFVRYCVLRSLAVCACFVARVLLVQSFLDQRRRRRIDFRGHLFCPLASNGHSGALTAENALCVCMRAEDAPADGPKSGWIQSAWTSVRYARATGASARAPGGGHGERQGEQVRHIVMGMRSGW